MKLDDTGIRQLTDSASVGRYTSDESSVYHGEATAVYLPRSVDEVEEIMREASRTATPVTISGAGTSLTGARVPSGGIVVSTERLRDIRFLGMCPEEAEAWDELREADAGIMVSPEERRALVPAGVRLSELDRLLATRGLLYPPDPTEMTAMLGGTIATNASGARSYRYGSSRSWIDALLVVTASGSPAWIRRGDHVTRSGRLDLPSAFPSDSLMMRSLPVPRAKHAAGLMLAPDVDLVDLIVGSEGILAVVVAAIVRVIPRPDSVIQIAAFYDSPDDALRGADAARSDTSVLSIEYFDGRALAFIRDEYPHTPHAGSCVMFEAGYDPSGSHNPYPRNDFLTRWTGRLRDTGASDEWVALGEELRGMKAFRHALPERVNRWVAARVGKLGTDMAVPAEAFPRMCEHYERACSAGIRTVAFGHLGQYHLHLNFLPENGDQLSRARDLYRDLAKHAVELGGTISAEHGIGKKELVDEDGTVRPYLYYLYGDTGIAAIQDVKRAFDPRWLLNPGTMVPRM